MQELIRNLTRRRAFEAKRKLAVQHEPRHHHHRHQRESGKWKRIDWRGRTWPSFIRSGHSRILLRNQCLTNKVGFFGQECQSRCCFEENAVAKQTLRQCRQREAFLESEQLARGTGMGQGRASEQEANKRLARSLSLSACPICKQSQTTSSIT